MQTVLFIINFFDHTVEVVEWPVNNSDKLSGFKYRLWCRLLTTRLDALKNRRSFCIGDRCRLISFTTDEPQHFRRFFYHVPADIVEIHLNQHITGKEFTFASTFFASAHLNNFFSGNKNFSELVLQAIQLYALVQCTHDLLLEAGISVNNIPSH
mgnify:CR=1 FL=1